MAIIRQLIATVAAVGISAHAHSGKLASMGLFPDIDNDHTDSLLGYREELSNSFADGSQSSAQDAGDAWAHFSDSLPKEPQQTQNGNGDAWKQIRIGSIPDNCDNLAAKVASNGDLTLAPTSDGDSQDSKLAAWGTYQDSMAQVGWGSVSMHTGRAASIDDGTKMYAAGAVEGYLTASRIRDFHHNSRALLDMNPDNQGRIPKLESALEKLFTEMKANDGSQDPISAQAHLVLLQTWGIRDGYMLATKNKASLADAPSLSMVDMFILNSDGVIDELLSKYGGEPSVLLQRRRSLRRQVVPAQVQSKPSHMRRMSQGHCTGVVRLADDKSELFFGHTTWESFSEMTRFWKVYDFPLQDAAAKKISFSSYPGCVSSTDDYYLMDSGLAITETTLNIPQSQQYPVGTRLPDFVRIMAANRVASDGESWVRSMSETATGTYSSQWMVVDYNKFSPGNDLPPGTFHVLEQAPGASHYEDMSGRLQEKGYWASFDRAFFDEIRASTGDDALQSKLERRGGQDAEMSELYSKSHTPRAQIVEHTFKDINSLNAMREEMTRNLGTNEPVDAASLRDPRFAISARSDLKDADHINPDGSPDGGVDAKVTSSCLFKSLTADAISSPSHSTLPPFRWTSEGRQLWPSYPHQGLPDVADFDWVRVDAQDEMLNNLQDGECH